MTSELLPVCLILKGVSDLRVFSLQALTANHPCIGHDFQDQKTPGKPPQNKDLPPPPPCPCNEKMKEKEMFQQRNETLARQFLSIPFLISFFFSVQTESHIFKTPIHS